MAGWKVGGITINYRSFGTPSNHTVYSCYVSTETQLGISTVSIHSFTQSLDPAMPEHWWHNNHPPLYMYACIVTSYSHLNLWRFRGFYVILFCGEYNKILKPFLKAFHLIRPDWPRSNDVTNDILWKYSTSISYRVWHLRHGSIPESYRLPLP